MAKKEVSEKIIELELKKLDIKREKAKLVLDKSIWLYFLFMIVGAMGYVYGYVNPRMLNLLIITAFIILIIGTIPYMITVSKEEKNINSFIEKLK